MSCDHYIEALGEYVDGTLAAETRRDLEAHLAQCASCERAARDLRSIRQAASTLPDRTPPDRVWARIANELETRGSTAGRSGRRGWLTLLGPLGWRGRFASIPALAAAVLLLAAAAGYLALGRPGARPGSSRATPATTQATTERASDADLVKSVQEELQLAESHYEKAIAGLEQIMKSGQGTLDPQIASTLQKNIALIDQAISDSRQALKSQPTSQLAQESLLEAFRRKVALLQDTVALINEMRKGNEAGAAKIIGNLNKS